MTMKYEGDPAATTLSAAKQWLRARSKTGARCPCCNQYVKVYKRALNTQMARWLIWLVRTWETANEQRQDAVPWIDIRRSPVRGGDYAKLLHWGLVEQKSRLKVKDHGSDTRDSGYWRPTHDGRNFVRGKLVVPSHVFLYDNIRVGVTDKQVAIWECLGKKYSYQELMNAPVSYEAHLP